MIQTQLDLLTNRCERFVENLQNRETDYHSQLLAKELAVAVQKSRGSFSKRPLSLALIGGSGVGKSYIFSILAGHPGLSPSSSSIRGFTRKPVIAASEDSRQFIPFSNDQAEFLPVAIDSAIMIDSPDLDTVVDNNAMTATKVMAFADLLVFVTTPDKRSDFQLQQNILAWASRKRWFFVMNKMDTVSDVPLETIKNDYFRRLADLGFTPDNNSVFFFSAKQPDSDEFVRFTKALSANHPQALTFLMQQEAAIRLIQHAFSTNQTIDYMNRQLQELKSNRSILCERLKESEARILSTPFLTTLANDVIVSASFSRLCETEGVDALLVTGDG
jgi:tRNA U34 5-carboxymethylaminomethyl modifying GTPase MnmE/TrmE